MSAVATGSTEDVVICGAGAAGLSTAAVLKELGVEGLVLERSDALASSWRRRYDGLRLNTLGWMSTQPGYHVGRRVRGFPSREAWIDYQERYARHHQLRVQLQTEAKRLDRQNGGWGVSTSRGPIRARHVVVATGYDLVPKMPDCPGLDGFAGELIHAASFRSPEAYRDRDVLVISAGVTGSELASFLADVGARRVRVAVRTPPNILRRCRFGVPLNPAGVLLDRLPAAIGDRATALSQRMMFGDLSPHGLPRPPKGVVSSLRERRVGPVIDDGFVDAVKQGRVEIVSAVESFGAEDVMLANGERIQPEVVIAATGYGRGLEPLVGHLGLIGEHGEPTVEHGESSPGAPGLYFVGYRAHLGGHLRGIRIDAKRVAKNIAKAIGRRDSSSGFGRVPPGP